MARSANLFDERFLASFHATLDAIEQEGSGAPVVTIGHDKHFSNGFDLEFLGTLQGDALLGFVERACRLLARILTFPAPTVAAVNGHAFGIGGMLALAHDRRVMRDDRGWFCLPEVDLGLPLHPFMQALVTNRLAAPVAAEAILTGARYDGRAALAAGVVDAVAPAPALVTTSVDHLAAWRGKQPPVLAMLKSSLYEGVTAALDGG
jgi:enoyl-CoA hydratase/carnithine racemase